MQMARGGYVLCFMFYVLCLGGRYSLFSVLLVSYAMWSSASESLDVRSSIKSYNITSIAHTHYTHTYTLLKHKY